MACCCCSSCSPGQQNVSQKRKAVLPMLGLLLVDCTVSVVLCVLQKSGSQTGSMLSAGVLDVIIVSAVRLALIMALSCFGFWAWHRVQPQAAQAESLNASQDGTSLHQISGSLLSGQHGDPESSPGSFMFSPEQLEGEKLRIEGSKKGESRRDGTIWAIFAVCSITAVYSGVKCVSFGTENAFDGSGSLLTFLIGLGVFLCHFEFYIAKKCLMTLTTAEGLDFPWLHPHTLHFVAKADCRRCQICRSRIQNSNHGGMAYFCPLCEQCYYCIECLKRQLRQRQPALSGAVDVSLEEAGNQRSSAFSYMRRMLPLVKPFVHIVVLSFLMVCVNQSFSIALPHWQGVLLDAVSKSESGAFKHAIAMYLAINICSGLFSSVQSSSVLVVVRKLAYRTRLMVFAHILRQDISYFDLNLAGQITSRLTSDTQVMTDPVNIIMNNLLSNLILLVGGLFMCFHTSWKLSILAMTVIFPITYLVRTYSEWAGKIQRKIQDEMSEANGVATQAIQNMRTVRYFGAENFELGRYEINLKNVYNLQMKDNFTRIANTTLTKYLDLGVGVFVLWYGGSVIISGDASHFSLGQLITFQLYWNMMKNAFNGLNTVISSLLRATAASQRILDLLDLNPTIETGRGDKLDDDQIVDGTICIENLTFHYTQKLSQKPVLWNVNLQLPGGKVTAIVGKSGSGKSTLASLLLRLYDPIHGRITLDGRDFREFQPQSLRAQFGVVAQETQLFAGTIEDNISYAMLKPYTREDLELAATKANALEFIMKYEDAFQSLVGDRGLLLSGGQKQRISIARMFLRRPKLLLLDEATSALDAENEALVQECLDGLVASGLCRTVVVIAHRLSTVRNADQIAVMEEGALKELGTHADLLEKDGIYAQLVQRQLQGKDFDKAAQTKGGGKGGKKAK